MLFRRRIKDDCCVACGKPGKPYLLGYRVDSDGHIWHTECLVEAALTDPEYQVGQPVFLGEGALSVTWDNIFRYYMATMPSHIKASYLQVIHQPG